MKDEITNMSQVRDNEKSDNQRESTDKLPNIGWVLYPLSYEGPTFLPEPRVESGRVIFLEHVYSARHSQWEAVRAISNEHGSPTAACCHQ